VHHTAGNANPELVYKGWNGDVSHVCTCIVIGGKKGNGNPYEDGTIVQGYSSSKWAYHLGLEQKTFDECKLPFLSLDRISIGIEICNWGYLTKDTNGIFKNYVGGIVDAAEVCDLGYKFRGYQYFHNYTDAQIQSTKDLLEYWGSKYNIDLSYNKDIFDICPRALKGDNGIFTHCSVRKDKTDIYPHPKMIDMLKSLKK
jgi:hypothetical protein